MASSTKNLFLVAAIVAAVAGVYSLGQKKPVEDHSNHTLPAANTAETPVKAGKGKILYYRNPMGLADTSPVPKQDSMGMDYVPVYENEAEEEPGTVRVSSERVQRLGVRTEVAERRILTPSLRAVGTVQMDETRHRIIAPRFEGWIGELRVNATGQSLKKGDVLFTFYSPQIVQIETEYLTLGGALQNARKGSLERLATLAVPEEEIARLQREKTVNNAIALRAPSEATVMEKQAVEGMKFAPGDMLYRLVDLSSVWIVVDVFEQDLARISVGQTAKITINALPGKIFEGKVDFIYPNINGTTRTAKIRVNLANEGGVLRTDMYANVEILMPSAEPVLVIPMSAILNNGQTKTVLVARGEGLFQPRSVKTGVESAEAVEIVEGLSVGDRVVTHASFLIDAESNIRAALQNFTSGEK